MLRLDCTWILLITTSLRKREREKGSKPFKPKINYQKKVEIDRIKIRKKLFEMITVNNSLGAKNDDKKGVSITLYYLIFLLVGKKI